MPKHTRLHKILFATAAALLVAVCSFGQTAKSKKIHSTPGINISLWRKVSTQPNDTVGSTMLNIGLLSSQNRLAGLGVNILGSIVRNDMNGLQMSGLFNVNGGEMNGIQMAGIANINGNRMNGGSIAGLMNITGDKSKGLTVSGLANITGEDSHGMNISGLVNISGDNSSGIAMSGLANIASGNFKGISASGLMNIAGKNMQGLQFSSLINIAAEELRGLQIGALNVATRAKGLQIGLFNFYSEKLDGFQLGLINANPDTKIEMAINAGSSSLFNVGLRFKNRYYYTILSMGYNYHKLDKTNISAGYRAGVRFKTIDKLYIGGDAGIQHIETFHRGRHGQPGHLFSLQERINMEYELNNRFTLIVSGGNDNSRDYHGHKFHNGLFFECGTFIALGKANK